jgi:hypothetical protein
MLFIASLNRQARQRTIDMASGRRGSGKRNRPPKKGKEAPRVQTPEWPKPIPPTAAQKAALKRLLKSLGN